MNKKKFKKLYRKYILDNDIIFYTLVFVLSIIAFLYLRFVMLTSKIHYKIDIDKKNLKNNTYILAFWHGRLLSAFFIRKFFAKSCVLISHSKGAYLVKLIANYFRTSVVRGSKNKGGSDGLREVLTLLKNEKTVFAIAPDGSIGPLMRCNSGIATISLLSKKEILPIMFSAKKGIFLKSWDKFFIPLPFNSITVHLKEPISPFEKDGNKKNAEDLRVEVEETLHNLIWSLDANYNHEKIIPKDVDKKGQPLKIK